SGSYINHALTVNPHVYISCIKQFWNTTMVKRSGDITRLQALVDKKRIMITEDVVREILQLNDAEGVFCLPNEEIFVGLARMGYEKPSTKLTFYKAFFSTQWKFFIHTILHSLSAKRTSWNEFNSAMASALICLSSGQRFNFSNYIFESLVRNVDSSSKFYMYPWFIQLIIQTNIADLSKHTTRYISHALTQKVFVNMRRVGKGFSRVETPLFESMLIVRDVAEEADAQIPTQGDDIQEPTAEEVTTDVVPPTPTSPSLSSPIIPSSPPNQPPCPPQPQDAKAAQQLEIVNLKARVKKLEKINKVKSSKLRRLKKVGTSQRIESSDDVENNAALDHVQSKEPQYIKRYHEMKKKPQTESKAHKNMIFYLKDTQGYKMDFFKGKKYDEILPIFQAKFDANMRKLSKEAQEAEDLRKRLEIVQDEDDDVFGEATPLAQKVPVVDYQIIVIDNKPKYPLLRFTLEQLVNVARLQVEEESEMSLELLRFTRQQL
nr:hypothetical protein [Tanacetum cinerariifolium]